MRIKIENARLSFPELFKPTAFKPGDPEKFKATFLIPKGSAQHKAIEKAMLEVGRARWGAKAEAIIKQIQNNPNKFCFQDGDTKSYDGYEGMMALAAKSSMRPLVIDRNRTPLSEADGKPYAGCYVNATVEFFGYDNSGNGMSCGFSGVQFVKDGDAFGGGAPADISDFDELAEGADADDLV